MQPVGHHLILELWECDPDSLNHAATVEHAVREAVNAIGATLVSLHVHPFPEIGLTGVAILAESHLTIHTWPQHGYAAVDVFTCGRGADPRKAVPVLQRCFSPRYMQLMRLERGIIVGKSAIVNEPGGICEGVRRDLV